MTTSIIERRRIGFFDSGMGGLTVLHLAQQAYPEAEYIYYADVDNVPYGKKSKKTIKKLVFKAVQFLVDQDIDILVVACNTATSVCIKKLRQRYDLPIIGMEPAVKPAVQLLKRPQHRILVCATRLTLKEKKLKDLITNLEASDKTDLLSLQKLVAFAEAQNFDSKKVSKYLHKKFKDKDLRGYTAVVLGCTHFIYYRELIKEILPKDIEIIDGNAGTVARLLFFLEQFPQADDQSRPSKIKVYFSGRKQKSKVLKPFLKFLNQQER